MRKISTYLIVTLDKYHPDFYQALLHDEEGRTHIETMWVDNWRDLAAGKYVDGYIKDNSLRPARSIGYAYDKPGADELP